jgi:POTRA domain, FtsQ-type
MGGTMVNYRPRREQRASHTYKRPLTRRASLDQQAQGGQGGQTKQYHQRVVTMAQEVEPASAWNDFEQRREQRFRAHQRQQTYTNMVPRRMSQSGQVPPVRRRLPSYNGSPIPKRSGRQRRGFLWKLLGFLAFVVVAVLGSSFALTSTAFRIEQVNVTGTRNSALIDTIQHMGMQGQNIFRADIVSLTARVEALPTVSSASVSRQWPNQLVVAVIERVPALLWQTNYGTYSVDAQGMVIAAASETPGVNQSMVVVDTRKDTTTAKGSGRIQPGSRLNAADVRFAMEIFARLPKVTGLTTFTLNYTDTISVAPGEAGSFVVVSPTGWRAYLGGTGDSNPLDNRLLELQQILAMAQQEQLHLATVDLRFGLRPVYTLQSSK